MSEVGLESFKLEKEKFTINYLKLKYVNWMVMETIL
jgi:hypothetical protein